MTWINRSRISRVSTGEGGRVVDEEDDGVVMEEGLIQPDKVACNTIVCMDREWCKVLEMHIWRVMIELIEPCDRDAV